MRKLLYFLVAGVLLFGSCDKDDTQPENPAIDIEMVTVEGGTFQMGSNYISDREQPVHSVTLSSFKLSKYEITHAQFIQFLNDAGVSSSGRFNAEMYVDIEDEDCAIGYNGSFYFKGSNHAETDDTPVTGVTWYGAKAFCEWAGGRLPTEAEWEFAARGGNLSKGYAYSGSNNIDDVAWNYTNSEEKLYPVGLKKPNELGFYDMSGNVGEWCSDRCSLYYYLDSPSENPQGPSVGSYRVVRGGSLFFLKTLCLVACRSNGLPEYGSIGTGFRFAYSLK